MELRSHGNEGCSDIPGILAVTDIKRDKRHSETRQTGGKEK